MKLTSLAQLQKIYIIQEHLMKFFHRRKDEITTRTNNSECRISMTDRDYAYFAENDIALKFRVNETLERMIDETATFLNISASDFIRQVLFVHLYGRYDLLGLIERQPDALKDREEEEDLLLSQQICLPETRQGKNVADFKVWLPFRMKDDLQLQADREKKTLSRYVRDIVAAHLTGHIALTAAPAKHRAGKK